MLAELQPEPEQPVDDNPVVGAYGAEIDVGIEPAFGEAARELLDRVARRPVVAESCRGDEAELAASDVSARAGAEVGGEVNGDDVIPLEKRSRRVLQDRKITRWNKIQ